MKITTVVIIFVDIEYRKVTQLYQLDKWSLIIILIIIVLF